MDVFGSDTCGMLLLCFIIYKQLMDTESISQCLCRFIIMYWSTSARGHGLVNSCCDFYYVLLQALGHGY